MIAAGVPSTTIYDRTRNRILRPVFTGTYLVARTSLSVDALHMAAVLAAGSRTALGGRSGAALWGIMRHLTPVDVYREAGGCNQSSKTPVRGSGRWPFLIVHRPRRLASDQVRHVRSIPVTSVPQTLKDLAGLVSGERFRFAFLEADRLGLLKDRELQACASNSSGHRGAGLFRQMVEARSPGIKRARSLLEGIYLDLVERGVVPPAELNVDVLGHEADLVWRLQGVVVELDGYEFHRGREAFEADAMRNNRMRAEGWSVLRITWRMLNGSPREVAGLIVNLLESTSGQAQIRR